MTVIGDNAERCALHGCGRGVSGMRFEALRFEALNKLMHCISTSMSDGVIVVNSFV